MAVVKNVVSDFTKSVVSDPARVTVTVGAKVWIADADANDDVVKHIQAVGRSQARRGRKKTA